MVIKAFVAVLALLSLFQPAEAQQPTKMPLIGYLSAAGSGGSGRNNQAAFRQGLHDLGYTEGKNIALEERFADGVNDRLPKLALELVRLKVDVIVTGGGTPSVLAAKNATKIIPIVFATSGDPVQAGVVPSLAQPGGNITGFILGGPELYGKRLELLKETFPRISRPGFFTNPTNPASALALKETKAAAHALRLDLQLLEVRSIEDLEGAFTAATRAQVDGLIVMQDSLFYSYRKRLVDLAAKSRLAAVYAETEWPNVGGLMSYGPDVNDNYRRAAAYVDRILRGVKPSELPVQRPTKFELVINLKTASRSASRFRQACWLERIG